MRLVPAFVVPFALVASAVAQITFQHERGKALVAADALVERLATGLQFTEGPVWDVAKQRLVFSDIPPQRWFTWTRLEGVRDLRASAGANGNTLDAELRLVSCRHDARDVVRHEADGSLTVLVDAHDGKKFNSPNDVAVHQDGSLWFTDPTYGLGKRTKEQAGNFVYRFDPKTKDVRVVQRDFDMPNGLCFAPDGKTLWIADSGKKQRIGAFPVRDDGTLGEPIRWLDGGADGVRCDTAGNLWAAARDGVRVFGPDGERLLTIALPEVPANLAFGGDDLRTLFVTARTSLYRVPVQVTGAVVAFALPLQKGAAGDTAPPAAKPGEQPKASGQR
jgi:gluconolactonase